MTLASVQASSRPAQAPGNEACESRQVKPKATPNHPGEPGQGKTDRVNVSEPLLRLRHRRSPKMMVATTAMTGHTGGRPLPLPPRTPRPRGTEDTRPRRASRVRNMVTPLRSGPPASKPDDLRKDGPTPQRAHDDPRSEGHPP